MDNYRISRDRAQAYFLNFDQDAVIRAWDLPHDDDYLYPVFLGRGYRIHRKTGSVIRQWDGREAEFQEVLSIFDLLCHQGDGKFASGRFAPVNSLKGRAKTVGVGTDFHTAPAKRFEQNMEGFRQACLRLGGEKVDMGDLGFRFPVFADLSVILKFYRSDEDFPASVTLLWDENTLRFVFYETVFYMAGCLLGAIGEEMCR